MLSFIWLGMMIIAVIVGIINGRLPAVVTAVTDNAKIAVTIAIGLAGIMGLWMGIMRIAEASGVVKVIARGIRPVLKKLFPDIPQDHPAFASITLNIAANMLGLTNAATPFGIQAMKHLESLNANPGVATNAMCTFLAINTSSVQLIPATAIAYLAAAGAVHPTDVIVSALIATSISTLAAIIFVKWFEKLSIFKGPDAAGPLIKSPSENSPESPLSSLETRS